MNYRTSPLSRYLPAFLRSSIENSKSLQRILTNTWWLFADRAMRLGVGLAINVWLARYLGPDQFGVFSFALAFVSIFSAIGTMGIDSIVIRDIARDPSSRDETLGTAFILMLGGGVISIAMAILSIMIARPADHLMLLLVGIMSCTFIFKAADVIDFWFQSQVLSKFTVFSRGGAFLLFAFVKLAMIVGGYPLVAFVWAGFFELVIGSFGLVFFYWRRGLSIKMWKVNLKTGKNLLREGWPLMLAFLSYLIYIRIDQVMIGTMLNDHAVGIYSVATRVFEIPVSLLVVVVASCFPLLTELFENDRTLFWVKYTQLTSWFTFAGFLTLGAVFFFGQEIFLTLFGVEFAAAFEVLGIQIFGFIFMANAGLRSSYLTIASKQKIILMTTTFSALMNIVMNYFMIPVWNINGAALATVMTQFLSLFLLNSFFSDTHGIFMIQVKSLCGFPLWKSLKERLG